MIANIDSNSIKADSNKKSDTSAISVIEKDSSAILFLKTTNVSKKQEKRIKNATQRFAEQIEKILAE